MLRGKSFLLHMSPTSIGATLVAIILLALIPVLVRQFEYLFTIIFSFAILAASWDLLYGYAGETSLGHVFPFGVSAFAAGLLSKYWWPLAMISGSVVAFIVNLGVAGAALRIRGPYFSILTLVTTIIGQQVAIIFWGEEGVYNIPPLFGGSLNNQYYFGLFLLVFSVLCMILIGRSKLGLKFRAMKDDPLAASTSGISILKYKMIAFILSSFFAGLAGAFYAFEIGQVNNSVFSIGNSFAVLSMAIFGGLGSILGPVLGAFSLQFINLYFSSLGPYTLVINGVIVMLVLAFSPGGLIRLLHQSVKRVRLWVNEPKSG